MNVSDNQKRWLVFGIVLNKVLVTRIRSFVEQEVQKEYGNLQTIHNIHTQTSAGRLQRWHTPLRYENINGNDTLPKLRGGKYDYSKFDYKVSSHVDLAKLYVEHHMAKFNAFDEHCDASAVLTLLGKVPVFPPAVQTAAGDVRQARNTWAHCVFSNWDPVRFQQSFAEMEQLVKALSLPIADEDFLLKELKDWENKGAILCMNVTIDPDLVKAVQRDVNALKNDVDKLAFKEEETKEQLKRALQEAVTDLEELSKRLLNMEQKQQVLKLDQSSLSARMTSAQDQISQLKSEQQDAQRRVTYLEDQIIKQDQSTLSAEMNLFQDQISELKYDQENAQSRVSQLAETLNTKVSTVVQEQVIIKENQWTLCEKVKTTQEEIGELQSEQGDVRRRVTYLEDQQSSSKTQISYEIASCEADITFFAELHDQGTRKWLLEDFSNWFSNPRDSRAYVLLGDAGVGKSVLAGVLAQRMKQSGNLGAAYFCRHNDDTRNNPRYLLETIACQLCKCNSQYNNIVGGEGGMRKLLGNCVLGVKELFTKLLLEPLAESNPCLQRKLVIIDALDETKYESREDFLDLIMHRFPLLPQWLVFFITSRPEDTVQFRLKKYNPCIKICAGNSENLNFYQKHEQDIKLFLDKRVDFSTLPFSMEDVAKKCNGLFLYAFFIAKFLMDPANSGKIGQLNDLFPGNIEEFFLQNFKRVFNKVGADLYKKLFGCATVAPSPLPVSFISFILQKENSDLEEQEVIDAVSLFVVLLTDKTFTFLHELIPAWLTDKEKASRKLFVDRVKAGEYFRNIIVEFLSAFVDTKAKKNPSTDDKILDYFLRVGVRFLCGFSDKDSLETISRCLTNFKFIQRRIQNNRSEICSLIEDFRLSAECHADDDVKKQVLEEICAALESNIFVLSERPNLLHSCLRCTFKAVQNVVLPSGISTTWMEYSPDSEIRHAMKCFVLSPDKKLLAGGRGKYISLFNASTLEKVQGLSYVKEVKDEIHHLEFSPDGKFLFFGRLDKWFSVEQRCITEFSQFADNCRLYKWSLFTSDGRYIVVKGDPPGTGKHDLSCLVSLFFIWAAKELEHIQGREMSSNFFLTHWLRELRSQKYVPRAVQDLLDIFTDYGLNSLDERKILSELLCPNCHEFEESYRKKTLVLVRQRVLELYSEIFEYQMWDVKSGKPVLEKAFSPGPQLSPFFFLCHLITPLEWKETLCYVDKGTSLFEVAFLNAVYNLFERGRRLNVSERLRPLCMMKLPIELLQHYVILSDPFSFFVANAPVEFTNHLLFTREARVVLAPNRKWIALGKQSKTSVVLPTIPQLERSEIVRGYVVGANVEHFAFMEDSTALLCYTEEKSLQFRRLPTRTELTAGWLIPSFCPPGKQAGYFLLAQKEGNGNFMNNLSRSLCGLILSKSYKTSLDATFILGGTILGFFPEVWKTAGFEDVDSLAHVKKFVFSQDGNVIAVHQGTKICMFDCVTFLYSLCSDQGESDVSYLAFSPDGKLLLYCIQNSNDNPRFYVWDVQNRVFSTSFDSPSQMLSIDCCCFSSDNLKLVICGEFSIEIWEYDAPPFHLIARVETSVFYSEVDKFTCCTVSPKHNLLACCITDRIVLLPLSRTTDQFIQQLPRAHLGKVEFCQFLKGNRYLVSYGVDGTVFLWDLIEWNVIAFAKVVQGRERIVSLCASNDEDKFFCLTSDERLIVLNLCGLEHTMLSTLPSPEVKSTGKMTQESRGPLREPYGLSVQGVQYSDQKKVCDNLDVDTLIEEMNMTCREDSGDSDFGDDGDAQD